MAETRLVEIYEMPSCKDPRTAVAHNPEVRRINEVTEVLGAEGVTVKLYSMNDNWNTFMRNPKVAGLVSQQQWKVLPITLVNGEIIKVEAYPTIEEIRSALAGSGGVEAPKGK